MELLTLENAIEEYPLFLYSLGMITKSIGYMRYISLLSIVVILIFTAVALWVIVTRLSWESIGKGTANIKAIGATVMMASVLSLLFSIPFNYLVSLEARGESEQLEVIASALENPEYREKVEAEFTKMGTSLDDVCSNEKNYPSLLCFKEKNGNDAGVGDKENQPVTWTDDGSSYSMKLVSEYDEKTDQITVSLEGEAL